MRVGVAAGLRLLFDFPFKTYKNICLNFFRCIFYLYGNKLMKFIYHRGGVNIYGYFLAKGFIIWDFYLIM